MNKREELIQKYSEDLKQKCKVKHEMELLTKVTIACSPAIYNKGASTVSTSNASEIKTLRNNFLIKKPGLQDSQESNIAIAEVLDIYGQSSRDKYRAVVYYLLTKRFGKESIFQN